MLRGMGADLVGMSTVLEAIAARAEGLEVFGLSLVTNLAAGITGEPLDHEEVLAAGRRRRQAGWARCCGSSCREWKTSCQPRFRLTTCDPGPARRRHRWIADDPDPTTRDELTRVLARRDGGHRRRGRRARRADGGPAAFGTAGLRGPVRAGPSG